MNISATDYWQSSYGNPIPVQFLNRNLVRCIMHESTPPSLSPYTHSHAQHKLGTSEFDVNGWHIPTNPQHWGSISKWSHLRHIHMDLPSTSARMIITELKTFNQLLTQKVNQTWSQCVTGPIKARACNGLSPWYKQSKLHTHHEAHHESLHEGNYELHLPLIAHVMMPRWCNTSPHTLTVVVQSA